MVTDITSQAASEAEIAQAQQEAMEAARRTQVQDGQVADGARELPGTVRPLQYKIRPEDEGSWVPVWELKLDANGDVYGDPTKAPRQQLGLWLQKKRADGGPRFAIERPRRLRAEASIPCLYNGQPPCSKKFYTRQDMVMHVNASHPMFAMVNKKFLDDIMLKVSEDNPRLAAMAEAIANMEDRGLVSVEVDAPQPKQPDVDVTAGAPQVTTLGIQKPDTPVLHYCGVGECARFFDSPQGANMHRMKDHKGELQ